ncbi:MAG: hypothetical protein GQ570_09555 [Helicobacteraceae bacterium]|nr:hypothetical protein [Helicobacteraceae bacterium]
MLEVLKLDQVNKADKFLKMEALFINTFTLQWHLNILNKRENSDQNFSEIYDVKKRLRNITNENSIISNKQKIIVTSNIE